MSIQSKSLVADTGRGRARRTAIVDVAERLFAENGVEGVSLRQIGVAAGASFPAIVTYHFGKKEDLIAAIIQHRLPYIERRRSEIVSRINGNKGNFVGRNLFALYYPLLEISSPPIGTLYATFINKVVHSKYRRIIDYEVNNVKSNRSTIYILECMKKFIGIDDGLFMFRMRCCSNSMNSAIQDILSADIDVDGKKSMFMDAISQNEAGLCSKEADSKLDDMFVK